MDMAVLIGAYVFVLGLLVGSFLNVVIYRYNTGLSITHGHSKCFSCGKRLSWYELIPLVSFLLQRGRCRACKSKISWQYPFVELFTGLLFLLVFLNTPLPVDISTSFLFFFAYYLFAVALLVIIFVYDARHHIIPNVFVYGFAALSLCALLVSGWQEGFDRAFFTALFTGPALAAPFAALWLFSRGRLMGLGDAKLALGIGWFLPPAAAVSAIVLSFWLGAVAGLSLIALSRLRGLSSRRMHFTMKSEIAFGPFMVLGVFAVLFTGADVLAWSASIADMILGI